MSEIPTCPPSMHYVSRGGSHRITGNLSVWVLRVTQISTIVVTPGIQPSLCEELLVKPLPSPTLEERLGGYTKGVACKGMPEPWVFTVGEKSFLQIDSMGCGFVIIGHLLFRIVQCSW